MGNYYSTYSSESGAADLDVAGVAKNDAAVNLIGFMPKSTASSEQNPTFEDESPVKNTIDALTEGLKYIDDSDSEGEDDVDEVEGKQEVDPDQEDDDDVEEKKDEGCVGAAATWADGCCERPELHGGHSLRGSGGQLPGYQVPQPPPDWRPGERRSKSPRQHIGRRSSWRS